MTFSVPALTKLALHFGLSLSHVLMESRLPYPTKRGYLELSYDPTSLNISGVIRELELDSTLLTIAPRKNDL